MTKEERITIIKEAIQSGIITLEELNELRSESYPTTIEQTDIDTLHLLMCKRGHDEKDCNYYLEERLDKNWTLPYHKFWLTMYRNYLQEHKISHTEFAMEIAIILGIDSQVHTLKHKPEFLFNYVHNLNKG